MGDPPLLPDLAVLDLLVTVSEVGSISAAAQLKFISQPSASAQISGLERLLGADLLTRTPAGSVPTEAGEIVIRWAQSLLADVATMSDELQRQRDQLNERLRVVANPVIGEHLLPRWLLEFNSMAPDVAVTVINSTDTTEHIVAGRAHVGFAPLTPETIPSSLATTIVGEDDLVLVAPPESTWVLRRRPMAAKELANERLVVRAHRVGSDSVRSTVERLLRPYRSSESPVAPLLELGSTNAVKAAVIDGWGPAILSRLAVNGDLQAGRLVEIPVDGISLTRQLHAVWRQSAPSGISAGRLINIAKGNTRYEVP